MTKVKLEIQRIDKTVGNYTGPMIRVKLVDPVSGAYELVMDFWDDIFGRNSWRFVTTQMRKFSLQLA
jgi:hypothetical protein